MKKTQINSSQNPTHQNTRLVSLDALRGFNMFWIIGGAELFVALAKWTNWPILNWWAEQQIHADWHGFSYHDIIFPLFIFIAGVVFPFSLSKKLQNNVTRKRIVFDILKRGFLLVILGCIYNGILNWPAHGLRFCSVLGRIGLAWMIAAFIHLYFKPKAQLFIGAIILIGYYLLLSLVHAPDYPEADIFSMHGNIASYIDRLLIPGHLYLTIHDPEGLLSTLPAAVNALIGIATGRLLLNNKLSSMRKTISMVSVGVCFVAIALVWNTFFPINKNLWTSSFTCLTSGLSLLLLAAFYYIIDVAKHRKWAYFFRVIGCNAFFIYLLEKIIDVPHTINFLFGGILSLPTSPAVASVLFYIFYLFILWIILWVLYKKNIYFRI